MVNMKYAMVNMHFATCGANRTLVIKASNGNHPLPERPVLQVDCRWHLRDRAYYLREQHPKTGNPAFPLPDINHETVFILFAF